MNVNVTGGDLVKTGFFLVSILIAVSVAFSADSPVKRVKQSSTQPAAKTDLGEWKKVIQAAKKEGKIVISGPPGEEWRKSQADMFQQEYPEIIVEYSAGAGRNFWSRVRQEREFGKKLWDLRLGGVETLSVEAKRDGFLAPIRSLLLPEIADDSKWFGGIDGVFYDREKKYMFGYALFATVAAAVNRDFIKESDLKTSAQLLDQKFKGKIVMLTPTGGATQKSLGQLAFMYGKNFIRELLSRQDPIVTDDNRQLGEWVVRGKYPIAIGFNRALLIPYEQNGLGTNVVGLEDKILQVGIGFGAIHLLEGAPHPNASKVYINWLLSQKTQTMLSKNLRQNSSRTDVTPIDKDTAIDQSRLSKARNTASEENIEFDDSLLPIIKEVLMK